MEQASQESNLSKTCFLMVGLAESMVSIIKAFYIPDNILGRL
jgi:hypothetical protein